MRFEGSELGCLGQDNQEMRTRRGLKVHFVRKGASDKRFNIIDLDSEVWDPDGHSQYHHFGPA